MTVQSSTDVHGRSWIYDPDVVYAIVRAAVRARIMRNRSRVVTENPAWYLPTTYYLDTNWQGYRPEMEAEAARYWQNAQLQLRRAPPRASLERRVSTTSTWSPPTRPHPLGRRSASSRSTRTPSPSRTARFAREVG